jgi:hypothetical protein
MSKKCPACGEDLTKIRGFTYDVTRFICSNIICQKTYSLSWRNREMKETTLPIPRRIQIKKIKKQLDDSIYTETQREALKKQLIELEKKNEDME